MPPARGDNIAWTVSFACGAEGTRATKVVLDIAEGDCAGTGAAVYQAAIVRGGGGATTSPGDLPPGVYAFRAAALDTAGTAVAQACVAVTLPSSQPVALLLVGASTCEDAGGGSNWPGTDGLVDGGVGADAGPSAMAGGDVDAGAVAMETGPRLELADTEFLPGESIVVGFADVKKAGMPFVGLYKERDGKLVVSFKIPFGRKEDTASGSHEFAAVADGNYAVRLVHDTDRVDDEVQIQVGKDRDGDGTLDPSDGCPDDRLKSAPGICGCGFLESFVDQDNDGLSDCFDACPIDAGKVKPLQCGCGQLDTDTDNDGKADCNDRCPDDPGKSGAGLCGCGVADTDTDMDGVPDCLDLCAADNGKSAPGICGCGASDADPDGDGAPACNDACPADRNKVAVGVCGCGVSDVDRDGDTVVDCFDGCPLDPAKLEPLVCGCGLVESDLNTDGDSALDCHDGCITDPNKTSAGTCGCGVLDTDSDGDNSADCVDACAADPTKTAVGICGCGRAEPFDTAGYRDAKGFSCADWKSYDCTQAVEKWQYTDTQETSILQNCSKTCNVCPP